MRSVPSIVLGLVLVTGCGAPPTGKTSAAFTGIWQPTWYSLANSGFLVQYGSSPSLVSWGPGRLDIFSKAAYTIECNAIYQSTGDFSGNWNGWAPLAQSLGCDIDSDVVGVASAGKLIDLFFRTTSNSLAEVYWNGGAWARQELGGTIQGKPAASQSYWRRDVFARGGGGAVFHRGFTGGGQGAYSDWEALGFTLPGDAVAVAESNWSIDLFYQDGPTLRYYRWHASSTYSMYNAPMAQSDWSGPYLVDSCVASLPAAVSTGEGNFDLVYSGCGDQGMYQRSMVNGVLGARSAVQGADCMKGNPTAVQNGTRTDLVIASFTEGIFLSNWTPATGNGGGHAAACCGLTNQACCTGTDLCRIAGEYCVSNKCIAEGQIGQPCAFGKCADGTVAACVNNTCVAAGKIGQPCNSYGSCTDPSSACGDNGTCVAAGALNEPCRPGSSCNAGLECLANRCVPCGGPNQRCCTVGGLNQCYDGTVCNAGTCLACGLAGQTCCPASLVYLFGSVCGRSNLQSTDPNSVVNLECVNDKCETCGYLNGPCCTSPHQAPCGHIANGVCVNHVCQGANGTSYKGGAAVIPSFANVDPFPGETFSLPWSITNYGDQATKTKAGFTVKIEFGAASPSGEGPDFNTIPPIISIASLAPGATVGGEVPIELPADENFYVVRITVDPDNFITNELGGVQTVTEYTLP